MIDSVSNGIRFGRIAAMLPVADMARAVDFDADALGFTKTFENGTPVGFMILKRDDAELHLTLQPGHKPAPFNIAHMMVENIDALHEAIRMTPNYPRAPKIALPTRTCVAPSWMAAS